jgi:hypothetical protein
MNQVTQAILAGVTAGAAGGVTETAYHHAMELRRI